jgi:16S rRNA (cytidine1402-2'-O)-methyltransferase
MPGTLFIVATPIGNLQDISLRAIETLSGVDIIACEDTRHTKKLLNHLGIKKRLVSYHEHNEEGRSSELVDILNEGKSVAVVSDAGTPAINDPGFRVVKKAIENGIDIVSIPGPSALITALSASGLPTDSFFFAGFLPAKKGERQRRLAELASLPATLIFYEAPHRLAVSLGDCLVTLGDRNAVVARELTKLHEEFSRGKLSDLAAKFRLQNPKGEIVLIVDRGGSESAAQASPKRLPERVSELESSGLDRKAALKQAAKEFNLSKSEAYRQMQNAKNS